MIQEQPKPKRIVHAKRRTERQVARILQALDGQEMTSRELADHLHMSYGNTKFYIRMLRDPVRQLRICRYVRSGGRSAEVYTLGTEPDAKYERQSKTRNPRPDTRALVLEVLGESHSMQMLMAKMGMSDRWLSTYVRSLRDAKQVYIDHWTRSCSSLVAHYKAGNKPDAPRLERKTRAEYYVQTKRKKVAWAAALGLAANGSMARAA